MTRIVSHLMTRLVSCQEQFGKIFQALQEMVGKREREREREREIGGAGSSVPNAECRICLFCAPHSSGFPGFTVNVTEWDVNVTECNGFCAGFFRDNRAFECLTSHFRVPDMDEKVARTRL